MVTALLPALGWAVDAGDPFFVRGFPWVVLAPVVLGLQNGFRYALVSGACLIGGAFAFRYLAQGAESVPVDYLLSVGLLGPLAGEYRDKWQRALELTRHENQQRGRRLEQFARAYHLLEWSHNELEQRIAGSGRSLERTLEHVHAQLVRSGAPALAGAGETILQLFSHYGQVQVAALYAVPAGGAARAAELERVASLGEVSSVDLEHPMIMDALATRELTSVREERAASRGAAPLACVPLVDAGDRLWAVILVHEMPFVAMSDDNMKLLAVLGGRVGDWLAECAGEAAAVADAADEAEAADAGDIADAGEAAEAAEAAEAVSRGVEEPGARVEEAVRV